MENELVTKHIEKLDEKNAEIIEFLRQTILNTADGIAEQIKWNSPSFYYAGEMKAFNAREYKRDIAVINLHRGSILLVFPTGAKVKDIEGLTAVNYPDGRKIIKISDIEDAKSKKITLQILVKNWLDEIEK